MWKGPQAAFRWGALQLMRGCFHLHQSKLLIKTTSRKRVVIPWSWSLALVSGSGNIHVLTAKHFWTHHGSDVMRYVWREIRIILWWWWWWWWICSFSEKAYLDTSTSLNMGGGEQINMTPTCVVHAKIKIVPSIFIHILHSQKTKAINNTTQVWWVLC